MVSPVATSSTASSESVSIVAATAAEALVAVANVLDIAWIEDALEQPARIICPRSSRCPRPERCEGARVRPSRAREIDDVREEILGREPAEES